MEKTKTKQTFLKIFFIFVVLLLLPWHVLDAASLAVSSSKVKVSPRDTFSISVSVNTQGKAINNVEAVISFPASLVEVTSVSAGSVLSLWVQNPTFSNGAGTISFNGGAPNPGFTGSGTVMTAQFKAKAAGTATISLASAAVRENDGKGTNILSSRSGATIEIQTVSTPAETPSKENQTPTPTAAELAKDKTPPSDIKASVSLNGSGQPVLEISAKDVGLGVDYFLIQDGKEQQRVPAKNNIASWVITKGGSGARAFLITAVDRSGNKSEREFSFVIPEPDQIVIDQITQTISAGDVVTLSGNSQHVNAKMLVYFRAPSGVVWSYEILTDATGRFSFQSEPIASPGDYTIWVQSSIGPDSQIKSKEYLVVVQKTLWQSLNSALKRVAQEFTYIRIIIFLLVVIAALGWFEYFKLKRLVSRTPELRDRLRIKK